MDIQRIGWISIILLLGCQQQQDQTFQDVSCNGLNTDYAQYKIFTPCKSYTYRAKYWDQHYNLISESLVRVTPTGDRVSEGVLNEQQAIAQFQYDEEDISTMEPYNINDELAGRSWIDQIPVGVFESESDVWMQPFRENQFVFTQVAPYPSVNLPLFEGKQ